MAIPRVLILRAAGTNCDEETQFAWSLAGAAATRAHINRLVEQPGRLSDYQILTIAGGFSYGDDIASGTVFAQQLRRHLAAELAAFVAGGGLVLGICNGFQVLVKAGLLPGPGLPPVTLMMNDSGRFEARWVTMRAGKSSCPLFEPGETLSLPIAHAEGKFVIGTGPGGERGPSAVAMLESAGCLALRYFNAENGLSDGPYNPNGSEGDIAGVCDASGRVFGLMPHPERFVRAEQRPDWTRVGNTEIDGLRFFRRAVARFR
ncbi:MAG: phosphoribosylformylglycinamidine synthase I [Phycisphaerae bacterium]